MKYLSAGHSNIKGPNHDPGAPGVNGRWEAIETAQLRNRVVQILRDQYRDTDIVTDIDGESLQQYLNRIKTGSGSVVVEFHFNAGVPTATGTEMLVELDADRLDILAGRKMAKATSDILGIPMRGVLGVKSEADTRHKRLALMKEEGIVVLAEVCFISNYNDMAKYDLHFEELCQAYARLIHEFEDWAA